MLGYGDIVWVTSVVKRYLAHACGAHIVHPSFDEASGTFLLVSVGKGALPKRHEAFVFIKRALSIGFNFGFVWASIG
jgi:hypothetical protein